jgi:hypothetical protein
MDFYEILVMKKSEMEQQILMSLVQTVFEKLNIPEEAYQASTLEHFKNG